MTNEFIKTNPVIPVNFSITANNTFQTIFDGASNAEGLYLISINDFKQTYTATDGIIFQVQKNSLNYLTFYRADGNFTFKDNRKMIITNSTTQPFIIQARTLGSDTARSFTGSVSIIKIRDLNTGEE